MRFLTSLLILVVAMSAQISLAGSIRATPLKLLQDDEGQKIIVMHEGSAQVLYLKKTTANYELLVDLFQISSESKRGLTAMMDEDYARTVISAKR